MRIISHIFGCSTSQLKYAAVATKAQRFIILEMPVASALQFIVLLSDCQH